MRWPIEPGPAFLIRSAELTSISIAVPTRDAQAKSARKATPTKKAPKGQTKAEVAKPKVAGGGSKTAKILDRVRPL